MKPKQGVILFAHGARSSAWAEPFQRLAAGLHSEQRPVQLAFLEFMEPDLPAAVDALVAQGCEELSLLPCFLAGAGHVMRDLPALQARAAQKHPALRWHVLPALGDHEPFQRAFLASCQEILGMA